MYKISPSDQSFSIPPGNVENARQHDIFNVGHANFHNFSFFSFPPYPMYGEGSPTVANTLLWLASTTVVQHSFTHWFWRLVWDRPSLCQCVWELWMKQNESEHKNSSRGWLYLDILRIAWFVDNAQWYPVISQNICFFRFDLIFWKWTDQFENNHFQFCHPLIYFLLIWNISISKSFLGSRTNLLQGSHMAL